MHAQRRGLRLAFTLAAALTALLGLAMTPSASASSGHPTGLLPVKAAGPALPAGVRRVCPARPGVMTCLSLIRAAGHTRTQPEIAGPSPYRPVDLQEAYNLVAASKNEGKGLTVAIVDGGDDPVAAADLAVYRKKWGLPACDTATGAGCVVKVNQDGKAGPLPAADPSGGWQVEESLDLDMVSAICPNCRILLVEANIQYFFAGGWNPTTVDLAAAEESAAALGAKFISNSWGGPEFPGAQAYDSAFHHPGVAITVAAGDDGYGASYPATGQFVTSVGGTSLTPAPRTSRGWAESVWEGTGSGCSALEAKPAWQTADDSSPDGCLNRTDNDVSADADPDPGVWVYDSYPNDGQVPGWAPIGGTSASSPIVAATYALAGTPKPGTYPASYLYRKGQAAHLYPVTSGSNGTCETYRAYLCHGKPGYNAPAGLGTPDGIAAFTAAAGTTTSVTDPGTQAVRTGAEVRIILQATDSAGSKLTYTARNLPSGLSVGPSGIISGTAPKTPVTSDVTVTAADASGAQGTVSFRIVVVPDLAAGYRPVTGRVLATNTFPALCLNGTGNGTGNGARAEFAQCSTSAGQQWAFVPDAGPHGLQALRIGGKCLELTGTANGSQLRQATCNGSADQAWSLERGDGTLWNPASGRCLTDPNVTGAAPAEIDDCGAAGDLDQAFTLPVGPMLSAVSKMCAEDPGNSATPGTAVRLEPCDGGSAQDWGDFSALQDITSGEPTTHHGLCLTASVRTDSDSALELVEGIPVLVAACSPGLSPPPNTDYLNSDWVTTTSGEIFNTDVGMCLADPGSASKKGTKLLLEDCDGDAGQIWAVG